MCVKQSRSDQGCVCVGQFVSAQGELVLEEEELVLVMRLQELKSQYRLLYEEQRSTKAEVSYCHHLVDQCRARLLTGEHPNPDPARYVPELTYREPRLTNCFVCVGAEFESWYNESFLLPEEVQAMLRTGGTIRPGLIPLDKALALVGQDP